MPDQIDPGSARPLETGKSSYEAAVARGWPMTDLIAASVAALAATESAELTEARARASTIRAFRSQSWAIEPGQDRRLAHREAAHLYMPGWPWEAVARSPRLMDVYRQYMRPTLVGALTGRPPRLWIRLVRDILIDY